MRIFSIELSSRMGSIAVIDDGVVTTEQSWEENFKNRQQLFDAMAAIQVDWNEVDLFAVGRGPGAFSGMRIAFSVANSLAAPAKKPVYALNSGAALASVFDEERVAVVGDARRNQVWAGLFNGVKLEKEFTLLALDELKDFVPEGTLVVSPEYERLEALLSSFRTPDVSASAYPEAGALGRLVFLRVEQGIASEPREPLYMHPPVFIEPRFPA